MMGHVRRRRALDKAQREGERHVAAVVEKLLDQRFKSLKRELRRASFRKRLIRTGTLYKDLEDWKRWIDLFTEQLKDALSYAALQLNNAEGQFWTSNQQQPVIVDGQDVVQNYQDRIGRLISSIPQGTLTNVQKTIADWYSTTGGMPELVSNLSQYFSPQRAKMIARTETGFIRSEVAYENMKAMGVTQWIWDTIPYDDGKICAFCASMQGTIHDVEEAMPPDSSHPNCRCGVSYAMDNQELVYGEQGIDNFPPAPETEGLSLEDYPANEPGENQIDAEMPDSG